MKLAHSTSLFALVAASFVLAAPLAAQTIGTAGAVNPDAVGMPPGGTTKTLNVGGNVVHRERITTTAKGSVQLVFVDRTTLNVGPNSQLVIDEFVYDPASNTGRMAATLTKGVMRFVGGQTSHTGGATIKTPATTLGVRGGVATISHDGTSGTRVVNHFGRISVQTPQGTEIIRRPGFGVTVANTNAAPAAPVRAARGEIAATNTQLTSKGGQTGGRRETPTDQGASKAVGQANAPVAPTLVQGQQQNTAQAAQVTTQPNTMQQDVPLQQVTQVASTGSQQTAQTTLPTVVPVVVPPVVVPPLPVKRFYAMTGSSVAGNVIPSAFIASGTMVESQILGYGAGGTNPDGTPNTTSRVLKAGAVINGQGTAQSSSIYVMTGTFFNNGTEMIFNGGVRGSTRLASGNNSGRLGTSLASTPGGLVMDQAYSPTSVNVDQNDFNAGGTQRVPATGGYANGIAPGVNYTFNATATRTTTPAGLGDNRPVRVLEGYSAGLMATNSNTSNLGQPSFQVNGDVYFDLTDASRFPAWIDVNRVGPNSNGQVPGGPTGPDNMLQSSIAFGYQGPGTGSRSTYVDYTNFGAREARRDDGTYLSSVSSGYTQSGLTGTVTPTNQAALLVTADTVNAAASFPGVSFCNCEYTKWGFWSVDQTRAGFTATGAPDTVRDRVHMGTWVAGVSSTHIDVPTTGTAIYSGHIVGSFKSGNNEYIAAGNFSNAVNFGTNSGAVAITNLDGRNYYGTTIIPLTTGPTPDRSFFYGTANNVPGGAAPVVSTIGSAQMTLYGNFMKNTASPVGEMAGSFSVSSAPGVNYIGAGTFAAAK